MIIRYDPAHATSFPGLFPSSWGGREKKKIFKLPKSAFIAVHLQLNELETFSQCLSLFLCSLTIAISEKNWIFI